MKVCPKISVIIPIYNEEKVLPILYKRTVGVLEQMDIPYEIIFVNDCSKDNSFELMKEFNNENAQVKILSFSRNFGHQVAITAGMSFCKGNAVVILDGDLQDPPELIPKFIEKWKDGYEVVYGIRKKRKENILKRIMYSLYYRLLQKLSKIDIPLDSGDCCLMDKRVVVLLNTMPERNRFVRGLRSWVGFRQIGLEYERDKRYAGKSKYSFFKLLKLGIDGIISFSEMPLKISIFFGLFISTVSIIYSFYIVFNRICNPGNQIPGWTSLVVGVTFLGGIQLMMMGFLGEYIIRIFDEVKARPQYILNSIIGFESKIPEDVSEISLHHERDT